MDIGGIIEQVRCLVQDIDTPYRYGDAVLIGYIGQSVQRIAVVRPDVFATLAEVTCGTSEAPGGVNLYAPDDSIRIIDCHAVVGGNAMKEIDKGALDRSTPDWRVKTPCAPREFARNVNNPNLMFVSPPARETDKVIIEYAQTPPEYNAPEAGEDATVEMLANISTVASSPASGALYSGGVCAYSMITLSVSRAGGDTNIKLGLFTLRANSRGAHGVLTRQSGVDLSSAPLSISFIALPPTTAWQSIIRILSSGAYKLTPPGASLVPQVTSAKVANTSGRTTAMRCTDWPI